MVKDVPILQYQALFTVIGTQYGGDGIHTFALPNLVNKQVYYLNQARFPFGLDSAANRRKTIKTTSSAGGFDF
jgi:microcystin-dependent protein